MMIEQQFGISIITVTLNECECLKTTIESVRSFKTLNPDISIEHCIIDGGSKDETIYFLKQQKDKSLKFISEQDDGIYHAMNKGAQLSIFEYIVFINSGDTLNQIIFKSDLIKQLIKGADVKSLAGFAFSAFYKIGIKSRIIPARFINTKAPVMPGLHQGMMYKRRNLIELPFDQNFRICGDYEQFARMHSKGYFFIPVNQVLSTLNSGGVSTKHPITLYKESVKITELHFNLDIYQKIKSRLKLITALTYVQLLIIYSRVTRY